MIPYANMDRFFAADSTRKIIVTDGVVNIFGNSYSVSGATITLTNEQINDESFCLRQDLCTDYQLRFGECTAAECSFSMSENIPTLKGKILKVYMYQDNNASTMLQLGKYRVVGDELVADTDYRQITMYDSMYDLLNANVAPWYNELLPDSTSVTTLGAMRKSLLDSVGIPHGYKKNQLMQNPTLASGYTNWTLSGVGTTASALTGEDGIRLVPLTQYSDVHQTSSVIESGHIYLISADIRNGADGTSTQEVAIGVGHGNQFTREGCYTRRIYPSPEWITYTALGRYTAHANGQGDPRGLVMTFGADPDPIDIRNVYVTDLTMWFGAGNEPMTVSEAYARGVPHSMDYDAGTQTDPALVNDDMSIKRTIAPQALSGADVIRAICEIEGCFGQIDNYGKFKFVELSPGVDDGLFPADNLYPADDLYPQDVNYAVTSITKAQYYDVTFEDYISESITELTIKSSSDDVGTTVGDAGNTYYIVGNILLAGKSSSELEEIGENTLSKMSNRYYKPFSVSCIGNPCHEVGDPIRINTTYRGIATYILQRELRGIQDLNDTYSAQGEQQCVEELNTISSQFTKVEDKITSVKIDTDGVRVSVQNLAAQERSDFQALSDSISLKVSKSNIVNDLNSKMSSSIVITPNRIQFNSTGSIVIDTTDFKLDANGNATFTGALSAGVSLSSPVITGGSISGATITSTGSGGAATEVTIAGGIIHVGHVSGGGETEISGGYIALDRSGVTTITMDAIYGEIYCEGSLECGLVECGGIRLNNTDLELVPITSGGTTYYVLGYED